MNRQTATATATATDTDTDTDTVRGMVIERSSQKLVNGRSAEGQPGERSPPRCFIRSEVALRTSALLWQRSRGRAAGQPVALRRPPILLIPLSARSFAMGAVDLSKRARFGVEGRWPCRGQVAVSPCRGQVAVSRAGRRVEGKSPCRGYGQPQFSKKTVLAP
jgi:hypothetical protein